MTPDQERKVCDALAAIPPAALYESLKKEAIVAVMFTLVCEEDKATEIFAQNGERRHHQNRIDAAW